jgi:MFS transporter, NNP family, nitrate/nitrite transporter
MNETRARTLVLSLSFIAFVLSFAAWLMFGVLGVKIQEEFGLTDMQLGLLVTIALLNGSIWRLPFGMLADRWGGKRTMFMLVAFSALASLLVPFAYDYPTLLIAAFLVGMAGTGFTIGSAWNAAWFPKNQQGFAMGFFGMGNVGASVTKIIGPGLIAVVPAAGYLGGFVPGGWRFVPFLYGILLIFSAISLLFAPSPDRKPAQGRSLVKMMAPLKQPRVWRFSLYYVVAFGAYIALCSTLPKFFMAVYKIDLQLASNLTLPFIFASSLLRPLGGWLSDLFGPRRVTITVFSLGSLFAALLFVPMSLPLFTILVTLLGLTQGIGKASTIKYVPVYYPNDVGAVVGLVGALGALGGAAMPVTFAWLKEATGIPQSMFWVVCGVNAISLALLGFAVAGIRREERRQIETPSMAVQPAQ